MPRKKEAARLYRVWRKESKAGQKQKDDVSELPVYWEDIDAEKERNTSVTFEQAEGQARTDMEDYLAAMPPYDFQILVGDLLRAMGYFVEWIVPPGRDGGVDNCTY